MKYLVSLILLASLFQPLHSVSYIDFLDAIIDQKVTELINSSYKVEKIVKTIQKNVKTDVSLQEIEEFLDSERSVAFFFCNQMQLKFDEMAPDSANKNQQTFKDLYFVLGSKLYVYYLECAQQKMLYRAVKNYDSLNFWRNEKFCETQSFFQKNILRSLSTTEYKKRVEDNIKQLEDLTNQTNSFLGLILHNQQLLQKAMSQQEFQQNLTEVVRLQDEFLHRSDQVCDDSNLSSVLKKSIDQLSWLSVHLSAQYAQCKHPSHVIRHWENYTLTTAAACVVAFVYMRYGDVIGQSTQIFWNEHIRGAVERNVNAYINNRGAPQINIERISTIDDQATLSALVDEELKQPEPLNDQSSSVVGATFYNGWNIASELMCKTTTNTVDANMTVEQKTELVRQRVRVILVNQLRNPLRVPLALTLEVQLKALEGKHLINNTINEVEQAGNSILKDVHMILGLTALIPALTLVAGGVSASKSLYKSMAYQPIRMLVRSLEVLLNDSLYQLVTFEKEGHLYFLTEQLKLNINVLTIAEQKMIDTDITSLQSSDLDYAQKFNVVKRMYRTYPCLVPGTI